MIERDGDRITSRYILGAPRNHVDLDTCVQG